MLGQGESELRNNLRLTALQGNRVVTPENLPESGLFFRADHFSLARRCVPVLLIMGLEGKAGLCGMKGWYEGSEFKALGDSSNLIRLG